MEDKLQLKCEEGRQPLPDWMQGTLASTERQRPSLELLAGLVQPSGEGAVREGLPAFKEAPCRTGSVLCWP